MHKLESSAKTVKEILFFRPVLTLSFTETSGRGVFSFVKANKIASEVLEHDNMFVNLLKMYIFTNVIVE